MRKYFLTGLILLLPLVVTVFVFLFLVNFLTKPFLGFTSNIMIKWNLFPQGLFFLNQEQLIHYGSQCLILLVLFSATILLGMLTRWFFLSALISCCDRLLHKIPLINTVYKTSQEIIKTLFSSDKNSFKTVVMVPFPQKGSYALGLISRESPLSCNKAAGEELLSVLIPTTPNPTTGFLLMFKKSDLIFVDMKPEDAIKYIVSCGVILPENKKKEFSELIK